MLEDYWLLTSDQFFTFPPPKNPPTCRADTPYPCAVSEEGHSCLLLKPLKGYFHTHKRHLRYLIGPKGQLLVWLVHRERFRLVMQDGPLERSKASKAVEVRWLNGRLKPLQTVIVIQATNKYLNIHYNINYS